MTDLEQYRGEALAQLARAETSKAVEAWHLDHMSRNGRLNQWRRKIGSVPPEGRKEFGRRVNLVADELLAAFSERKKRVELDSLSERMQREAVDVTLPTRPRRTGGFHPITQMLRTVCDVFTAMGFSIYEAPHVELDVYNFELLNMPLYHPARDMQDTFYVTPEVLLRTHTSPGQIRAMQEYAPEPVRLILPGLCYRNEAITPRSEIQFHQVEGLVIGPNIQMSDLKGILIQFARAVFGEDQDVRLRGSYFPFTEPSVEVDVHCLLCRGVGCRLCKHTGWLELLGAGMVHPIVLRNGGYDPERVRGIAFGMGIERIVLQLHQIDDIRYFFQNDLRFLRQFN
jgi:phenylalanyl-tRNA synthetase alpha chain